jgi:hypothetical protein
MDQRALDAFHRRGLAHWIAMIIRGLQDLARRRATLDEVASAMRFFAPLWPSIFDDIGDRAAFLSLVQKALKGTLRGKPYDDLLFKAFDDAYKANGWPTPRQFCDADC